MQPITYPMKRSESTLTSGFGPRWGTNHNGQDLGANHGTPYYAAFDGTVVRAGAASGFGHWIVIDSQAEAGWDTVYGHSYASGILVRPGQRVRAGDRIGLVGSDGGSTGPHLHFEMWTPPGRFGGRPVDPAPYLNGAPEPGYIAPPPPVVEPGFLHLLSPDQLAVVLAGSAQWASPQRTSA